MSFEMRVLPLRRPARAAGGIGIARALAAGAAVLVLGLSPRVAVAATPETLAELNRLQANVHDAAVAYEEATSRAQELDARVDSIADEILHIEQEVLPVSQRRAADAASDLYKARASNGGSLALLLNAESFADFINLTKYLGSMQNAHVSALEDLDDLERELNGKLEELGAAKDESEAELQRATQALGEARTAAAELQKKADAEDAEEAAIARKAAEEAARLEQDQNAGQNGGSSSDGGVNQPPQGDQEGNSGAGGSSGDGGSSGSGGSSGDGSSSGSGNGDAGGNGGDGASESPGGWMTGVASYYGIGDGFMGGTTASGEKVTETSMGIAMLNVPFGTRVEIRYGGRSVIAYVNDRGPYAHGRVIDMQPAVARALNFLSVGVGTVQYRFL